MKLNEITAFVLVAETGSVQAAAARLHMTQSAVSRLVQRLETELRTLLFDRQTKPLSLTHDGHAALEHGRRVLAIVGDFSSALSPTGEPTGLLRIGAAHALSPLVAGRPLDLLRERYPKLVLQIASDWTGGLVERVHTGALDGAVILLPAGAEPRHDLHARRLRDEEICLIGSTARAATPPGSLREMNEIGWIVQPEGCGYRAALTQALERLGAGPPRIVVEAFGQDLQMSVVARGAGFGLLPASQLRGLGEGRGVRAVQAPDFQLTVSLWFVRQHQAGRLTSALDAIEQIVTEME